MAAGEVIDSWAAVVRELIDNALDAEATRITIELCPQDWRIRVTDNGKGIRTDDLPFVAQAYTTSKQSPSSPPFSVKSLGFRGEALHSLAQVSQLSLQTRASADPHGWRVTYTQAGRLKDQDPAAMAQGTIVTVDELFANWPSRRTAIGWGAKVLRDVVEKLQYAALAHPAVTWQLWVNDKVHTALWAGGSALDIIPQLLPRVEQADLRRLHTQDLDLIVGLPDRCHRARPDWVRVAVNRRFVRDPELLHSVQKAFLHQLPRSRHPVCVAQLTIPIEGVDWNRHPAKLDLYLQHQEEYCQRLQQSIQQLIATTSGVPTPRSVKLLKASEAKQTYRTCPATAAIPGSDPLTRVSTDPLIALAQLQNTYILAQHSAGLWLVEQHVAHERIRYEDFQREWILVELETPLILKHLTTAQVDHLTQMGMDPEVFGQAVWRVRRIPAVFAAELSQAEQVEVILELSYCQDLEAAKVTAACQTAIRNGVRLTHDEMQQLLNAWQATANPHTCPHGRPTYLALAETDLARYFRRSWTICERPVDPLKQAEPGSRLGDLFAQNIRERQNSSVGEIL